MNNVNDIETFAARPEVAIGDVELHKRINGYAQPRGSLVAAQVSPGGQMCVRVVRHDL